MGRGIPTSDITSSFVFLKLRLYIQNYYYYYYIIYYYYIDIIILDYILSNNTYGTIGVKWKRRNC
jgi:hypothetical protein